MRIMAKTAAQMRNTSKVPLSLKVTLYGTKPPVWRRLLIPGEMTLGDLHQAIQAAMGWEGGHPHASDIAGRQYGDPDSLDEVADEERLTLNKVLVWGYRCQGSSSAAAFLRLGSVGRRLQTNPRGVRHRARVIAPRACIRWASWGPNHDAAMRISGEAPGRRVQSEQRL